MRFKFIIPALIAGSLLFATDELPWIDRVLQPVASLELGYQHFESLGNCRYPGDDFFANAGLLFALSTDVCFEVEARGTSTHQHNFTLDQLKQTGRYVILDDARGDLFAFSVGLELVEPMAVGLRDPSFIHHSLFDTELHAAIGKEWICLDEYVWRLYGLGAVGMGIEGYPWMRGAIASEYRYNYQHYFRGKLIGEGGFGNRNIHLNHFRGYGSIAYRLVDVELEYTYVKCDLECTVRFLQSLYRHNCPRNLQQVSFMLTYPFNL